VEAVNEMQDDRSSALARFVYGQIGLADLALELGQVIALDYEDSSHRAAKFNAEWTAPAVVFSRVDVCRTIDRFMGFQITEDELSDWAATIRLLDLCYVLDPQDHAPDVVWDVLERLMAPAVWGEIDRDGVKQLAASLGCTE
jgi:hypothetical protein